jgi:HTH-type transcriptional regulator / antitoxin HigA
MAYTPNKAIHPGHIVARVLEREGMTQKNLCERTGLSEKHVSQIINGEASLTVETALLLENALGGAASFWINLEKNYQETVARLERVSLLKKEAGNVGRFPYAELIKRGQVEQTSHREKKVENLWKFFGVNSLAFVSTTEAIAYRKRPGKEVKIEAIAAWLRCGELEGKKRKIPPFSDRKLKQNVSKLRGITSKDPKDFSQEAQELLAEAGAQLVYVPHFPGTGVSAAVRWVGDNPLIQLSLLGAYADIFWFNLFHEIGHVLLHRKKEKFIEFDNRDLSAAQEKEKDADNYASDVLIPKDAYGRFLGQRNFSKAAVAKFAKDIGIHPGIVEGRLCHDAVTPVVSWAKPLGFRDRLQFVNQT